MSKNTARKPDSPEASRPCGAGVCAAVSGKTVKKESDRLNCWEIKGCGREPGGKKVGEFGICPAATAKKLDGVHGGKNAGRSCWLVAGTMCGGAVQGTFAQKYGNCEMCDFFKSVREEETPSSKASELLPERKKRLKPSS